MQHVVYESIPLPDRLGSPLPEPLLVMLPRLNRLSSFAATFRRYWNTSCRRDNRSSPGSGSPITDIRRGEFADIVAVVRADGEGDDGAEGGRASFLTDSTPVQLYEQRADSH